MTRQPSSKELTLQQRSLVIGDHRNGISYRKLAEKYGVSKSTIGSIVNNVEDIEKRIESNINRNNFRLRLSGTLLQIDEQVYDWYLNARSNDIPVNGRILQEQAKIVAENLGLSGFRASNGWLQNFKCRHSISFKALLGESANMDTSQDLVQQSLISPNDVVVNKESKPTCMGSSNNEIENCILSHCSPDLNTEEVGASKHEDDIEKLGLPPTYTQFLASFEIMKKYVEFYKDDASADIMSLEQVAKSMTSIHDKQIKNSKITDYFVGGSV